ncbi:hypothetical protein [Streptomyces sp. NPDC006971]|uniref:hypothetical protein n=1 Tax=Streptomyces sp. NPDC006971 TaxID=3154784 RepID=UPI00340B84B6
MIPALAIPVLAIPVLAIPVLAGRRHPGAVEEPVPPAAATLAAGGDAVTNEPR